MVEGEGGWGEVMDSQFVFSAEIGVSVFHIQWQIDVKKNNEQKEKPHHAGLLLNPPLFITYK